MNPTTRNSLMIGGALIVVALLLTCGPMNDWFGAGAAGVKSPPDVAAGPPGLNAAGSLAGGAAGAIVGGQLGSSLAEAEAAAAGALEDQKRIEGLESELDDTAPGSDRADLEDGIGGGTYATRGISDGSDRVAEVLDNLDGVDRVGESAAATAAGITAAGSTAGTAAAAAVTSGANSGSAAVGIPVSRAVTTPVAAADLPSVGAAGSGLSADLSGGATNLAELGEPGFGDAVGAFDRAFDAGGFSAVGELAGATEGIGIGEGSSFAAGKVVNRFAPPVASPGGSALSLADAGKRFGNLGGARNACDSPGAGCRNLNAASGISVPTVPPIVGGQRPTD